MDKTPEAVLLHSLFRQLSHRNVRYAVMRNHEALPESAGGSDLDLMVHPADGEAAGAAIEAAVRRGGRARRPWRLYWRQQIHWIL